MTDELESVTRMLEALKLAPADEVGAIFAELLPRARFIPAAQRREVVEAFRAWASSGSNQDVRKRAYAVFLVALDRFMAEELHEALRLITESRAMFAAERDDEGLGLCAMLAGAIYRTFGNFDLALKVLWEGQELLKASGRYPVFLAANANSIANIGFEMGHIDEAQKMFQLAYDAADRAGDTYFSIYAMHGVGRVHARQGRGAEAEAAFTSALAAARGAGIPLHVANSLTELASFRFDAGAVEDAERLSIEALVIRDQHRFQAGAVTNCLRIAEIRGLRGTGAGALPMLQRALAIAEDLKLKPKMAQAHQQMAALHERRGQLAESLEHFKRFHALREEVEREDAARRLSDARAIFDAEQAKKENAVIRAQRDEIERKNRELQDTIDELTRAKIGRRAKAFTLAIAVVLFIFQDAILGTVLRVLPSSNYFVLLVVKMAIIFSLSPINRAIEGYLLRRVLRRQRESAVTQTRPAP